MRVTVYGNMMYHEYLFPKLYHARKRIMSILKENNFEIKLNNYLADLGLMYAIEARTLLCM